jgi:competence protein ComGC
MMIMIMMIIIIIIIPEQHRGKARIQGTGEDRYMGHCTHTHTNTHIP